MGAEGVGRCARGVITAVALATASLGCLPMPALRAPAISGRVVDAGTGAPLANALVVVRWDARYGDLLPDRDLIGLAEVHTDANGEFRAGPVWRLGIGLWPLVRPEARVVGVMRHGYLCGRPAAVAQGGFVRIALTAAADTADRRASCRPVSARESETPRYLAEWRALHSARPGTPERDRALQIDRVLTARSALGFGATCEGPVMDLAMAPGGGRVGYRSAGPGGARATVLATAGAVAAVASLPIELPREGQWSLGWSRADELVLYEPSNRQAGAHSLSLVQIAGAAPRVLWRAGDLPAAPAPGVSTAAVLDTRDHSRARWHGRAFQVVRSLDLQTGLASEALRVALDDGTAHQIALPGEPCGPRGRFGRPQERVDEGGRTAFDLRYVKGGCHAVAIDLASGAWRIVDRARGRGVCRDSRAVPASQLATALRGYLDRVETALEEVDADPAASWSLRIEEDGHTSVVSRGYEGGVRIAAVPDFPVATPLRRIDAALLGGGSAARQRPVPADLEPL